MRHIALRFSNIREYAESRSVMAEMTSDYLALTNQALDFRTFSATMASLRALEMA
jgi:hypothetical protein